jgi:hypothetical protein
VEIPWYGVVLSFDAVEPSRAYLLSKKKTFLALHFPSPTSPLLFQTTNTITLKAPSPHQLLLPHLIILLTIAIAMQNLLSGFYISDSS